MGNRPGKAFSTKLRSLRTVSRTRPLEVLRRKMAIRLIWWWCAGWITGSGGKGAGRPIKGFRPGIGAK